jgi:hypothetical protein
MTPRKTTRAVDVVLVVFQALSEDEKAELHERIAEQILLSGVADESEMARCIRSLKRVAQEVGREPSVDDYRIISARLIESGEDIEPFKHLYAYFGGTWRRAREAFALSHSTVPGRIEARFRARLLGKVARYTDETLKETMDHCVEEFGRPPRLNEFERWRRRELSLAEAAGNPNAQLPSATPYRRRWGTWEDALRALGYREEAICGRLEL